MIDDDQTLAERRRELDEHPADASERERARYQRRVAAFVDDNLPIKDAQRLAAQLLERDRGLDDRRVCYECEHYKASNGWCRLYNHGTLRWIMQRCPGFKLKEVER